MNALKLKRGRDATHYTATMLLKRSIILCLSVCSLWFYILMVAHVCRSCWIVETAFSQPSTETLQIQIPCLENATKYQKHFTPLFLRYAWLNLIESRGPRLSSVTHKHTHANTQLCLCDCIEGLSAATHTQFHFISKSKHNWNWHS